MKLAIVGTSKLTEKERETAMVEIEFLIQYYGELELITGDAQGVDALVRLLAPEFKVTMIKAIENKWEGRYGYKARNSMIAAECDELVCITTKTKTTKCYHCNMDHQRTGGCWTMKEAKRLGKPTRLLVV